MERAAAKFPCQSGKLRIQIVNSTLWVDHSREPWPASGWYPAELGGGALQTPSTELIVVVLLSLGFWAHIFDADLIITVKIMINKNNTGKIVRRVGTSTCLGPNPESSNTAVCSAHHDKIHLPRYESKKYCSGAIRSDGIQSRPPAR